MHFVDVIFNQNDYKSFQSFVYFVCYCCRRMPDNQNLQEIYNSPSSFVGTHSRARINEPTQSISG